MPSRDRFKKRQWRRVGMPILEGIERRWRGRQRCNMDGVISPGRRMKFAKEDPSDKLQQSQEARVQPGQLDR
jgi:hypothetical protein